MSSDTQPRIDVDQSSYKATQGNVKVKETSTAHDIYKSHILNVVDTSGEGVVLQAVQDKAGSFQN